MKKSIGPKRVDVIFIDLIFHPSSQIKSVSGPLYNVIGSQLDYAKYIVSVFENDSIIANSADLD